MTAVLITRPGGPADRLVPMLEALGYEVCAVPTVATRPVELALPDLTGYDWVMVTSATGVHALPGFPAGPRWAAVGGTTAAALRARGVEPDLVPTRSNGAALADSLPDPRGARVLLVRADAAASDLPRRLRERGAAVDEVTAYTTIEGPAGSRQPLLDALANPDLAGVVFASGSAVRGYLKLGGTAALPAVTIGPRTTAAARHAGFRVLGEAEAQTAAALAGAVLRALPLEETGHA